MTQQITIDPVTRLEGHGKIEIFLDEEGDVENTYFQIPELRGFERFFCGLYSGHTGKGWVQSPQSNVTNSKLENIQTTYERKQTHRRHMCTYRTSYTLAASLRETTPNTHKTTSKFARRMITGFWV